MGACISSRALEIASSLEVWASLVSSGYAVPAASVRMSEASVALREMHSTIEEIKRALPKPYSVGQYKGDRFYPLGGTFASHEWDGEKWESLI